MNLTARLNKRVTIKQLTTTTDEYGQPQDTWTDFCTVWAGIEPLQGREYFAADQENAEVKVRIRLRHRNGIDRTMKVVYKTTEYEIIDIINPKMENWELQLMCKERQ